jgi:signal transduction histidine kinase/streptogramin lyase
VGTFGAGLDRLDPATGRFTHLPPGGDAGPAGAVVTALHEDEAGALWVGTWGDGLSRRDPVTGRFTHLRHRAGDARSLPNDVVTTLLPARDGGLWVGTYGGGVARLDRATGRFRTYGAAPAGPLSHATVYGLHETPDGVLWIATAGGGLNRLDSATGTVRVLTTRDGLPHNIVYAVLPDDAGRLWLSTNHGLAVYDPARNAVVRTYTAADGLQGDEFNSGAALRQADGTLLFGGTQGFNRFRPDRLTANAVPPPVVLTGLQRFGEPVRLARAMPYVGGVRLSHRDNFVTFEFAALDYTDPAGNRYRYRLDGLDDDWRETDGRAPRASYTNLPGGRYTFLVQAANPDGVWNTAGARLSVRVVPPWWQTLWARLLALALAVLAVAGAGAAAQRTRQRRAERVRADEREAQRRLAEVREAERLRTARDLHDGPLQDLYGARYRLEALEDALSGDGLAATGAVQEQAAAVRETLLTASRQLRDVCAELRPPVLGPMGLGRALQATAARLGEGRTETLTVEADDSAALPDAARVALYRVAQEAIRNALRHARATRVSVRLRRAGDAVDLTVEDDGVGFAVPRHLAELARHDHLGLVGAAERVGAVGGRLDVTSSPGRGTTVRARVPLQPPPAP